MNVSSVFSRSNTTAIKGLCAMGILVFHIALYLDLSPVFNVWGSVIVAIFLMLSGYGMNESYKKRGLQDYWKKRLTKIILPFVVFVVGFNLLSADGTWRTCVDELLYLKDTYWFVHHLLRCYLVFWMAMHLPKRWQIPFLGVCALLCFCFTMQLEAEQAISFLAGVLISRHRERCEKISSRSLMGILLVSFLIGLFFYLLKLVPSLHELKGTFAYNIFLLPLKFSWGVAFLLLGSMLRLGRFKATQVVGSYSLEIYICHIPLMQRIVDVPSVLPFLFYTALGLMGLILFRKLMNIER